MKCANPKCDAEGLYLRSGSLHTLDIVVADLQESGGETINRRIVWLCGTCTRQFDVETWRPPGEQLQPAKENQRLPSGFRPRLKQMELRRSKSHLNIE